MADVETKEQNQTEAKPELSEKEKKVKADAAKEGAALPALSRPLDKMTVKELKEIGLQIPSLVGVHGMKKEELLGILREIYGVKEEVVRAGVQAITDMKSQIKTLQHQKAEARKEGDKQRINVLRRKINRLKKRTRKAARAAA